MCERIGEYEYCLHVAVQALDTQRLSDCLQISLSLLFPILFFDCGYIMLVYVN